MTSVADSATYFHIDMLPIYSRRESAGLKKNSDYFCNLYKIKKNLYFTLFSNIMKFLFFRLQISDYEMACINKR